MGKDKPWESRPPREQDRIIAEQCWLLSSPPVCLCVCIGTGQFDFINDKETQQGRGREEKMKGLNDEVTWWGVRDRFKWDYTEGERAQTLSSTLLNLHNTEQDIAAPSALFTVRSQVCCVNKSPSSSCLQAKAALRQRMHWNELEYSAVIVFKCLVLAFAPHVFPSSETHIALVFQK